MQLKTTGKWFYADYSSFYLDAEYSHYAIHVAGFSGVAGDSLSNNTVPMTNQNEMGFSTPDADHDGDSNATSCASMYNAGWWFNYCFGPVLPALTVTITA